MIKHGLGESVNYFLGTHRRQEFVARSRGLGLRGSSDGTAGFQPAFRPISAGWKPALPLSSLFFLRLGGRRNLSLQFDLRQSPSGQLAVERRDIG